MCNGTQSLYANVRLYWRAEPRLLKRDITEEQIVEICQLIRMAFYALQFGKSLVSSPVVVSLASETNWHRKIRRLHKSPAELWDFFRDAIEMSSLSKKELSWQHIARLITENSLDELSHYLSTHPCL